MAIVVEKAGSCRDLGDNGIVNPANPCPTLFFFRHGFPFIQLGARQHLTPAFDNWSWVVASVAFKAKNQQEVLVSTTVIPMSKS